MPLYSVHSRTNILEIKCDGALPKCDWCHHHSIPCTYARNEDLDRSRKTQDTKLKLVSYISRLRPEISASSCLGFQLQLSARCRLTGANVARSPPTSDVSTPIEQGRLPLSITYGVYFPL